MHTNGFAIRRMGAAALMTVLLGSTALAGVTPGTDTGPGAVRGTSSSQSPYLLPTNPGSLVVPGWGSTSLLTTGDAIGGYTMAGIPDGLGAYDNGNGTITVLMNHEIGAGQGNAHGPIASGSFVSSWIVNKNTLQVVSGSDLITSLSLTSGTTSINRLCSADLPALTAFYNPNTGLGYDGRIFMTGEETAGGRQFGVVATGSGAVGTAYQLPLLGAFAHENALARPVASNQTVVVGNDDTAGGRISVYLGTKTNSGTAVDKAGLTNGTGYFINVTGVATETRNGGIGAGPRSFTLSTSAGTGFLRPEDGAWDPKSKNVYYFTTTDQYDQTKDGVGAQSGRTRLWKVTFGLDANGDVDPTQAGTIESVLPDNHPGNMFDNMTIGADGKIYLQEDVGNQAHNGKIYEYDPATGKLTLIYQHDPARFGDLNLAATPPFNRDEESSGIIDVTSLFTDAAWYQAGVHQRVLLADVQAHFATGNPATVEGGQLLLLVQTPEPATLALFGLGLVGLGAMRRRR